MTESIDYDLGYFEAMRNAVVAAIQCHMNGMEIGDIIKHLAQLRESGLMYGETLILHGKDSPLSNRFRVSIQTDQSAVRHQLL